MNKSLNLFVDYYMALSLKEFHRNSFFENSHQRKFEEDRRILEEFFTSADTIRYLTIRSVTARSFVNEIRQQEPDREITLATISDEYWDRLLLNGGIHALYIIGIYEPSSAAREDSLQYLEHYKHILHDNTLDESQIVGSGFALISDNLNPVVAQNWEQWKAMVERFNQRGVLICPDFVPNHVALDHPWREDHPEYLLRVNEFTYRNKPKNYLRYINSNGEVQYFARGKHYTNEGQEEVWTDTLQIDFRNPEVRRVMIERFLHLVEVANMTRVDTAPLPSYEIFRQTWGDIVPIGEKWDFWGDAVLAARHKAESLHKSFTIIGEAYDSPYVLNDFDSVYGSALYGELVNVTRGYGSYHAVLRELNYAYHREGLPKHLNFGSNHDLEPTIDKFGDLRKTLAALTITSFTPGDLLIHHGEEELRVNPPMQVVEPYVESLWPDLAEITKLDYEWRLFFRNSSVVQEGRASLLDTGSPIIAQQYELQDKGVIMCTNLNSDSSMCSIPLVSGLTKESVRVFDFDSFSFLDRRVISDPSTGKMTIILKPWGRQMVLYDIKKYF